MEIKGDIKFGQQSDINLINYTWPAADANGYLHSDGSGNLSWLPVSGGGTGTVTSFTFIDANGFDGTVTNPTTTPALTLTTTVANTHVIYSTNGAVTGSPNFLWHNSISRMEVTGEGYIHGVATNPMSGSNRGIFWNTVNWNSPVGQTNGAVYSGGYSLLQYNLNSPVNLNAAALHSAQLNLLLINSTTSASAVVAQGASGGKRAVSANAAMVQLGTVPGGITTSINHVAGLQVYGPQAQNGSSQTSLPFIQNYYGLLLADAGEYTNVTPKITTRWGVYQAGTGDKNYFGGLIYNEQLKTTGTAPVTNGTIKMMVCDEDGLLSFDDVPSGGTSGSGTSGSDGTSGINGTSGTSGVDGSGTSGSSGLNGTSGTSGATGANGTSGTSGNGTSGTSGAAGTSGTDGTSGSNGTSGVDGADGTSGVNGTSGITGTSGSSGTSGGGASITADNGLNMSTLTNVQWGGTLIENTTINANSLYYTEFSNFPYFYVNSTTDPIATDSSNAQAHFEFSAIDVVLRCEDTGGAQGTKFWIDYNGQGNNRVFLETWHDTSSVWSKIYMDAGNLSGSANGIMSFDQSHGKFVWKGLTNLTSQTALLGIDTTNNYYGTGKQMGYITLGSGLSLSNGVLSASSTVSANNGLTENVADNIQLGGTLLQTTTINATASYTLAITGSTQTNVFTVSSTSGGAIRGQSTTGTAIQGVASGSAAYSGYFESAGAGGIGIYAQANNNVNSKGGWFSSANGLAIQANINPASTNASAEVIQLYRNTTGTAANGIGGHIGFQIETTTSIGEAGRVGFSWADATHATRAGRFNVDVTTAGAIAATTMMYITAAGLMVLTQGAPEYTDNAAAVAAGLPTGAIYRTGDNLKIVH